MEDRDMLGIDEVLERLDNYSHRSDEYRTKCPSHDGESDDSLAIRENGKGKVLLHCHAGCDFEEIVEALGLENGRSRGASKPIGPKEDKGTKTLTVEDLPGASNEYMVFEKEDGTPHIIQRHKGTVYRVVGFDEDGDPLLAVGLGDFEPILFGLPELREAIFHGKPIVHTEGCKDALTVQRRLEMAGVTSGSCTSWKSRFAQDYEGANEVCIIPDNDDEGRDYAQQVAQDLAGIVPIIKIVDLPGLGPKEDLTDWIDAGGTPEEFLEIVEGTPALEDMDPWPEKPTKLKVGLPPVEQFDRDLLRNRWRVGC
jgi:putative DNA primase/helicase